MYRTELNWPDGLIVRQGDRNSHVKVVQEWLTLCGHPCGAIDGVLGPATAKALEMALGARECNAEGFRLLSLPLSHALELPRDPGDFRAKLLAAAAQHLLEHPVEIGGDNRGPWVRTYNRGTEQAWCAGFVCTLLEQAGEASGAASIYDYTLWVPALAANAKRRAKFVAGADATPASVLPGSLFFVRGGTAGWSHTGIVTGWNPDGKFATVEGNTNDEGLPNGFEVCARARAPASCDFGIL